MFTLSGETHILWEYMFTTSGEHIGVLIDHVVNVDKSDVTFGWNGFNNALTLFYLSQEETQYSKDHSYPLVGGLSPSVSFSLVQTKYLGQPYSGSTLQYYQ